MQPMLDLRSSPFHRRPKPHSRQRDTGLIQLKFFKNQKLSPIYLSMMFPGFGQPSARRTMLCHRQDSSSAESGSDWSTDVTSSIFESAAILLSGTQYFVDARRGRSASRARAAAVVSMVVQQMRILVALRE